MKDIIIDTLLDVIKLVPFLLIAFIIIELLEHKLNKKINKIILKSGKFGPVIGGALGTIPQCGFSVLATNFYVTRVITLGTLFAIYLSTSDEMLPIMISGGMPLKTIIIILLFKFICGMAFGFLIDSVINKGKKTVKPNYNLCNEEHCDCDHNIFKSALKHTLNTLLFVVIVTFMLNILYEYVGEDLIRNIFVNKTIFGPFIGSLIGLIPNCGSSIILTELYINKIINLGTLMSGLLTGSGVALLVLFKTNKNIKENIFITSTLYLIGVLIGIFIEIFRILI